MEFFVIRNFPELLVISKSYFQLHILTNWLSESLSQSFSFGHLKWENFRTSQHREWCLFSQTLCHSHTVKFKYNVSQLYMVGISNKENYMRKSTYAKAVLPVPGWPPIRIALPAILPSLIILKITPAALLASAYQNQIFG